MKQELFDLYNECKAKFANAIVTELEKSGKIVPFESPIRISLPSESDEFLEEITGVEYDNDEHIWYAHNYITDIELQAEEYYTPLRDMSFDELFRIAERL